MNTRLSARHRKSGRPLTESAITRILSRTLPKRNGYRIPNAAELLKEANAFGISTELQFRLLLLKHRSKLIADDRECLGSRALMNAWREDYGEAQVRDMRKRQYCFSWEGLTRNALELEFGQAYDKFARDRDGL